MPYRKYDAYVNPDTGVFKGEGLGLRSEVDFGSVGIGIFGVILWVWRPCFVCIECLCYSLGASLLAP